MQIILNLLPFMWKFRKYTIVGVVIALFAVAGVRVHLNAFNKGMNECKLQAAVQTIEIQRGVHHAYEQAAANAPRSRTDVIDRLRTGSF